MIKNDTRNMVSLFPIILCVVFIIEALRKKTYILGFRPGPTQNRLNNHSRWLEARNFRFTREKNRTIYVAKKDANQLRGYLLADLSLCFRICKIAGFLMTLLK